jgi:hypothetical protein
VSGVAVGYHTLVATQYNANGTPKSGTPGRASFQVTASRAARASVVPSPLTTPLGLAGAGALATFALVVRRRRSPSASAA